MSGSRQAVLDRLAASLDTRVGRPPTAQPVLPVVAPVLAERAALLDRFTAALDTLSVTWELAENPITARLRLVTELNAQGIRQVLAWSPDDLPVSGVVEALDVLGVSARTPNLRTLPQRLRPQDPPLRDELLASIEAIDTGITGADAAIAATGTLFLAAGPGRPLVVSQLPRQHIVLLPVSRIAPTLESWLAGQPRVLQSGPLTALTGVSRTRDIELHPSVGIHGPRRRHVIIVQEL